MPNAVRDSWPEGPLHPAQRRYLAEDLVRLRRSNEQRRYVAPQRAGKILANRAVLIAKHRPRKALIPRKPRRRRCRLEQPRLIQRPPHLRIADPDRLEPPAHVSDARV